jgi:DNA-binding response OmpR family regulator
MTSTDVKVALIEDDQNLQNMYKFKLELEGFSVATALDGHEGLKVIETFMPDLILLDLSMPVMPGDEMLAKLRESEWGSHMRVIILTNISKNEAPQSLRFLNVDRYVVKAHSTPAQVVGVIEEVLGLSKQPAR